MIINNIEFPNKIKKIVDSASISNQIGIPKLEQIQKGPVSPKELLIYQTQLASYHLRVEMMSKVADSFLGTIRKLQSQ